MKTTRVLVVAVMVGLSSLSAIAEPLIVDLQRRLTDSDVDALNAYLSANWETRMAPLGRLVRHCDVDALGLSVRLLDTTNLEAHQAHVFSLELAMGQCPEKVLPLVPASHVRSLCSVDAYSEMFPSRKLTAEIDRRVSVIKKMSRLAVSGNGTACLEAYAAARSAQR